MSKLGSGFWKIGSDMKNLFANTSQEHNIKNKDEEVKKVNFKYSERKSIVKRTESSHPLFSNSAPTSYRSAAQSNNQSSPHHRKSKLSKTSSAPIQQQMFNKHLALRDSSKKHSASHTRLTIANSLPHHHSSRYDGRTTSNDIRYRNDDEISLSGSNTSDHLYETIDGYLTEDEDDLFLSISPKRRSILNFYGTTGWDFECVSNTN